MKRRSFITLAAMATLMAAPAVAAPQWSGVERAPVAPAQADVTQMVRRQISASEARAIALRRVSGQVVDIRRTPSAYVVRILRPDNRLVDIEVDADTGRIRRVT